VKKLAIAYFFSLFFFLSFFVSGVIDSQDGFQYLAVARNIYYKGKPSSPPNEFDTNVWKNVYMSTVKGKDGDSYAYTGLGYSLAMVPAVAITDLVYKIYRVLPPTYFPLENDWLLPLMASFTNAFLGALLGTTLFLYFQKLKLSVKQAILMSLVTIFATNLFVYTKHAMAHMMFITFLVLSFYLLKLFSTTVKKKYLFFSGLSLGVVMITYNATYLLTLPPYALYYLLLTKPTLRLHEISKNIKQVLLIGLGILPFFLVYRWFEDLRTFSGPTMSSPVFLSSFATNRLLKVPVTIFFEGLYGQLLSPGRGFFMYSPILALVGMFWFKLRKIYLPEILVALLFFVIYLLFYASLFSVGQPGQGLTSMWTGESSWGPRYLTPVIPFVMLVVGGIYTKLKKIQKIFIFLPLIIVGLYIEFLGVLMPYQIKYHDLNRNFVVNQTEFTMYDYVNLIPRYSPIMMMSRKLVKLVESFPKTLDNGLYTVRFWDGIDFPFNVGPERWRSIEGKGYIKFDSRDDQPVRSLSLGVINHVMGETNSPVTVIFNINGDTGSQKTVVLKPRERIVIEIPVDEKILINKDNLLEISSSFGDKKVEKGKTQIFAIISLVINKTGVNLESIDVPYVSILGPAMMGVTYQTYGGLIADPWKYWEIHTQMFERLPDFWWIRNLYYWDIPKVFIFGLLGFNLLAFSVSFLVLKRSFKVK